VAGPRFRRNRYDLSVIVAAAVFAAVTAGCGVAGRHTSGAVGAACVANRIGLNKWRYYRRSRIGTDDWRSLIGTDNRRFRTWFHSLIRPDNRRTARSGMLVRTHHRRTIRSLVWTDDRRTRFFIKRTDNLRTVIRRKRTDHPDFSLLVGCSASVSHQISPLCENVP
jgi:hypothetical protein